MVRDKIFFSQRRPHYVSFTYLLIMVIKTCPNKTMDILEHILNETI